MRRPLIIALSLTTALGASLVVGGGSAVAADGRGVVDFNADGYADLAVSAPGATVDGKAEAGYVSVAYGGSGGVGAGGRVTLTAGAGGVPGQVDENDGFGWVTTAADLDDDGFDDLVVQAARGETVVLWGSADGLGKGSVLPDVKGAKFNSGDFNGDGHEDLVSDDYPYDMDDGRGGMTIHYGPFGRDGKPAKADPIPTSDTFGPYDIVVGDITGDGADEIVTSHGFEEMAYQGQYWQGGSGGLSHTPKKLTSFNNGVIGDVDGDGYGDLVFRDTGTVWETDHMLAGNVSVIYGSASGLSTRTKKITQNTAGVPGADEGGNDSNEGDQFGASLTVGDVTGDGIDDVAAGVPGEDIGSGSSAKRDAGAVVLLKGSRSGLTGTGAQAFHQSTTGVPGASEHGDKFGTEVFLLDVNNNNRADLAVGVPNEDGAHQDSGAYWLFRGSKNGLVTSNIASFGPVDLGTPEAGARLGHRFAD
ncbi:hypothetical protein ACIBI4_14200 [Streptomyces sp. NPDC050418]|uniref:hypothetical protein n=1 Tax=Streptomyces sp. NPDC050418 TaxID=3365612 RepID=UPI0037A96175